MTAILAAQDFRVIVPFLRGFGSTRFLSAGTVRNGQQAATGHDLIALMDVLNIDRAILGGYDWGGRTANVVAALWPQRCSGLVAVSGYIVVDLEANREPLPARAEYGWWYQYYFATPRGELGYRRYTKEFNRLIWQNASPHWHFDDATYDQSAAAFDNPDHADVVVVHNYRWRLSLAAGEDRYAADERRLAAKHGTAYRTLYTGAYEHRVLVGIGHNVPQEAPHQFAATISDVSRMPTPPR